MSVRAYMHTYSPRYSLNFASATKSSVFLRYEMVSIALKICQYQFIFSFIIIIIIINMIMMMMMIIIIIIIIIITENVCG